MFICASFEFLKFQMLINFNVKFNVRCCFFYNSCCIFNIPKHQLCRSTLADQFLIGKTAAAKIVTNEASIRQEYERFKGNLKRNREEQTNKINEILYEWFKKCCQANIYPDGQMLKEKSFEIKKHLNNDEFLTFTASNGWLERWKISYSIREKRVNGEAGEVSRETVNAWMERLWEVTKDYNLVDI